MGGVCRSCFWMCKCGLFRSKCECLNGSLFSLPWHRHGWFPRGVCQSQAHRHHHRSRGQCRERRPHLQRGWRLLEKVASPGRYWWPVPLCPSRRWVWRVRNSWGKRVEILPWQCSRDRALSTAASAALPHPLGDLLLSFSLSVAWEKQHSCRQLFSFALWFAMQVKEGSCKWQITF